MGVYFFVGVEHETVTKTMKLNGNTNTGKSMPLGCSKAVKQIATTHILTLVTLRWNLQLTCLCTELPALFQR